MLPDESENKFLASSGNISQRSLLQNFKRSTGLKFWKEGSFSETPNQGAKRLFGVLRGEA